MAGGQAGLAGHLNIGSGARIGAHAGLMRDVEPGQTVMGTPAVPAVAFWRQVAMIQRLARKKDRE
jgi:UDP-3-O-[3-hydroxymyristoyl] glucosamine N-acyltransferase